MSETTEEEIQKKIHPSADRIAHLRHQVNERKEAARRVFRKSGTKPTERQLINEAGERLRQEYESDYDPLTGLLEKRGYEKERTKAVERALREKIKASVAFIDLDELKTVNDTLGHEAGDQLLKSAADAIRASTRTTDIPARIGGDEFQVFLMDTTPKLAENWKKRLVEEMKLRNVSASIGLSGVDLNDVSASVRTADQNMYKEKTRKKQEIKNG